MSVPEFGKNLAADAARRDGRLEIADNGDRAEFAFALGDGCEDRGAFGAIGGAVGRVLDVAAVNDGAVIGQQSGADLEFGVGRVSALTGLKGCIEQFRFDGVSAAMFAALPASAAPKKVPPAGPREVRSLRVSPPCATALADSARVAQGRPYREVCQSFAALRSVIGLGDAAFERQRGELACPRGCVP